MTIYLDHAATTPVLTCAMNAMIPWLAGAKVGNPSSAHSAGEEARLAVEHAREQVAALIGAEPHEIFFTSGGTESDNLALQGYSVEAQRYGQTQKSLIVSGIEHHAILNTAEFLRQHCNTDVVKLVTTREGVVDVRDLEDALRISQRPCLVSVMLANNETGVIQPIQHISNICKTHHAAVHTDAVQAVGHMPVDVNQLGVDMLSISGHKFGAPDGVGALYIRRSMQELMSPMFHGGKQERGMRAGTENVAAIVGLGAVAEWTAENLEWIPGHYRELRKAFLSELFAGLGNMVTVNGGGDILPNILSVTIPGVQSESLLLMMDADDVYISAASACSAGSAMPSHVLTAMGIGAAKAHCTVRISFGIENSVGNVVAAARKLVENAKRIKSMYRGE